MEEYTALAIILPSLFLMIIIIAWLIFHYDFLTEKEKTNRSRIMGELGYEQTSEIGLSVPVWQKENPNDT